MAVMTVADNGVVEIEVGAFVSGTGGVRSALNRALSAGDMERLASLVREAYGEGVLPCMLSKQELASLARKAGLKEAALIAYHAPRTRGQVSARAKKKFAARPKFALQA